MGETKIDRYAEDANYWATTVHPAKSLAEIQELLEEFGVLNIIITQGQVKGRFAWLIRFQWNDRTYRFIFSPLECHFPSSTSRFGDKKRTHEDQAKWQMGRIAAWFVKAILTAAEAHPGALFGFLELPKASPGELPLVTSELDVSGLVSVLPDLGTKLLLSASIDQEVSDG